MSPISELAHRLHESEIQLLHSLRHARRQRTHPREGELSVGDRIADSVAATVGSWRFIITQSVVLLAWMTLNVTAWVQNWDPYPFILLNLVLSCLAALQAPIILMSQNRAARMDRRQARADYEVNLKAELEIIALHQKLDELRDRPWRELVAQQERQLALLEKLAARVPRGDA